MKKYEQPLMEIDNIVIEDAILSSTSFGNTSNQAGDIDLNLF